MIPKYYFSGHFERCCSIGFEIAKPTIRAKVQEGIGVGMQIEYLWGFQYILNQCIQEGISAAQKKIPLDIALLWLLPLPPPPPGSKLILDPCEDPCQIVLQPGNIVSQIGSACIQERFSAAQKNINGP